MAIFLCLPVKSRRSNDITGRHQRLVDSDVPFGSMRGPYETTTATFMKTPMKKRLRLPSLFFAIIPRGRVT